MRPSNSICQCISIFCIIKLHMARPLRTWNQIVQTMVQCIVHTKCTHQYPLQCWLFGQGSLQGSWMRIGSWSTICDFWNTLHHFALGERPAFRETLKTINKILFVKNSYFECHSKSCCGSQFKSILLPSHRHRKSPPRNSSSKSSLQNNQILKFNLFLESL